MQNYSFPVTQQSWSASSANNSPLDNPDYNALDSYTLRKIATYLKALEELEESINNEGMSIWLNSPILVQGEGYRVGWLKPVDDFWVFVPDVKEDERVV